MDNEKKEQRKAMAAARKAKRLKALADFPHAELISRPQKVSVILEGGDDGLLLEIRKFGPWHKESGRDVEHTFLRGSFTAWADFLQAMICRYNGAVEEANRITSGMRITRLAPIELAEEKTEDGGDSGSGSPPGEPLTSTTGKAD